MLVLFQAEMRYETSLKMRCEICLMSQGVSYLTNWYDETFIDKKYIDNLVANQITVRQA
jgi:hypothetical protein